MTHLSSDSPISEIPLSLEATQASTILHVVHAGSKLALVLAVGQSSCLLQAVLARTSEDARTAVMAALRAKTWCFFNG